MPKSKQTKLSQAKRARELEDQMFLREYNELVKKHGRFLKPILSFAEDSLSVRLVLVLGTEQRSVAGASDEVHLQEEL